MNLLKFRHDCKLDYISWMELHPECRVIRGRDIGKKAWAASMPWVLITCSECGAERWVDLRKVVSGKLVTRMCRSCWARHNKISLGIKNPNWKGGKSRASDGYIYVYISADDPLFFMASRSICRTSGYIAEHRLVMARHLERCLQPWEIVHHKNGVRHDNRLENLELIESRIKHHAYNLLQKELYKLQAENQELKITLADKELGYIVLDEADYRKAIGQFRLAIGAVLSVFNKYGMDAYIPSAQNEIVKLAEDFGLRVRGEDKPISIEYIRRQQDIEKNMFVGGRFYGEKLDKEEK